VERSGFSISVLLDFSKAFDTKFGLRSTACRLFDNFFSPRIQKVMSNKECSDSVDINIGNPQGSVLSPILFVCFINDVGDYVRNCGLHLYADDLQI
jgi:hypothetical protein